MSLFNLEQICITPQIQRISYTDYDLETVISWIKQIGKKLCNKSDFIIDDYNKYVIIDLVRWLYGDKSSKFDLNKGFMFYGITGVGKTILLKIIFEFSRCCDSSKNEKTHSGGLLFLKNGKYCPINPMQLKFNSLTTEMLLSQNYEDYKKCLNRASLFLDEVGREHQEVNVYGNKLKVFEEIIYHRENIGGLLFCTSNFDEKQLTELYGEPVIRRLKTLVNFVEFFGDDRTNQ